MKTDIVFWGTFIASVLFLVAAILYSWGIRKGMNGHVEDAYMAVLFLALASNYSYLWVARLFMYLDYDQFMFLLVRTKYVPPVYLTVLVMVPLVIHKFFKIRRK